MGVLKLEDMHYTYDDYKLWEGKWELMNGMAVSMNPAPMRKHQSLASEMYLVKAPEIIVEIISPTTAHRDEKYKFEMYEKEKVKYYIIIYPENLTDFERVFRRFRKKNVK